MSLDHVMREILTWQIALGLTFHLSLIGDIWCFPTQRYWNGIKQILRHLKGMEDLWMFYKFGEDSNIKGYMDVGELPLQSTSREITNIMFFLDKKPWCLGNNEAESYNHIFRPFENYNLAWALHDCVWLQMVDGFIKGSWGFPMFQNFQW